MNSTIRTYYVYTQVVVLMGQRGDARQVAEERCGHELVHELLLFLQISLQHDPIAALVHN